MIRKPVVIASDIIPAKEPNQEFGYIRVSETRLYPDPFEPEEKRKSILSCLITGKVADLEELGYKVGQEIEGYLEIVEQLEPFDPDEAGKTRDLKIAGGTGVVCSIDGKPIHRKVFYREPHDDILLRHDNIDEIRKAFLERKGGSL